MSDCKKCLNREWCESVGNAGEREDCSGFKDINRFIEFPCAIGDTVYRICPVSPGVEFGDLYNGRFVKEDCQRCAWCTVPCFGVGYIEGRHNIIREVKVLNIEWLAMRVRYFGKVYFTVREDAEHYLEFCKTLERVYGRKEQTAGADM